MKGIFDRAIFDRIIFDDVVAGGIPSKHNKPRQRRLLVIGAPVEATVDTSIDRRKVKRIARKAAQVQAKARPFPQPANDDEEEALILLLAA
jgi:hypothetical protein